MFIVTVTTHIGGHGGAINKKKENDDCLLSLLH
jgi:hypothetical protein